MPDSPLQDVIDSVRTRLQAELESQLSAVAEGHGAAVERARADAEQAAEQRWAARLESTRAEWSARLNSEVESARAEAERRLVAEAMRVRVEAEQAAAETAATARAQLEQSLVEERERAQQILEAERSSAEARLEAERERARAQLDDERARAERALAEAALAAEVERERSAGVIDRAPGLDAGRLLESIAAIDAAGSLSDILALTAAASAVEAPRAALFVVNGPQLEEWRVPDVPALSNGIVRTQAPDAGLLGQAASSGAMAASAPGGPYPPGFAGLPEGRAGLAVPLVLGGQVVGVLYADEAPGGEAPGAWRDAVQILGRHASARLAFLTAMRTAQALGLTRDQSTAPDAARQVVDDDQGARRYARLLVSEIKLYNEAAVRTGREKRDLLRRLKPEIDRARRLYDERIPASIAGRDACFQQELVQTLADGDAALLG